MASRRSRSPFSTWYAPTLGGGRRLRLEFLCVCVQDHPNDRAWLKKVFDTVVGPDGKLGDEQAQDFLVCFYRARIDGPTQSGGYVPLCPPSELQFLRELCAPGPLPFEALLDALQDAQGAPCSSPSLPLLSLSPPVPPPSLPLTTHPPSSPALIPQPNNPTPHADTPSFQPN